MRTLIEIFFTPAMAIARLGSSPEPLESFEWRQSRGAHGGTETVIEPAVSLRVEPDGRVTPYAPKAVRFKDDDGSIRPVAPFFELWARLQSARDGGIEETPVTLALLAELGVGLEHLRFEITASNLKAARRTGDIACSFTARAEIAGGDHRPHALRASSRHTSGQTPLVSADRPIPLGSVQVMRPVAGAFEDFPHVNPGIVRLRFTPAAGKVYGPPRAVRGPDRLTLTGALDVLEFSRNEEGRIHEIVKPENRILNDDTPWSTYIMVTGLYEDPQPQDSYDGADVGNSQSWGVVDDTCDAVLRATLAWGGERYDATARVFVGPPDFAPDRRPFYNVADDLADRDLPPVTVAPETLDRTRHEVLDLFRRVLETASLLNLDAARTQALQDNAGRLDGRPVPGHGLPRVGPESMTREDKPYVDRMPDLTPAQEPSLFTSSPRHGRLSYTPAARFVHAQLMDDAILVDFLKRNAAHVRRLLRPPFGVVREWAEHPGPEPSPGFRDPRVLRDMLHDMRMPPYMRDAYYAPLSLTRRQYRMLMDFLDRLEAETPAAQSPPRAHSTASPSEGEGSGGG